VVREWDSREFVDRRLGVIYLFAVFFTLWAITFAYVFSLSLRQRQLQQELEVLQRRADERVRASGERSR
jgi:CcmD family protein